MNLQSELRNWWSSIQLRRNAAPFRVECDQGGFAQISEGAGEGHRVRLEWGQITEVFAFKRDCLLTDQIRIIVGNPDLKEWIEVPAAFHWQPPLTILAATILAVESLVFVGVHIKYREIAPMILSGVLGLLLAFIAYGRMVLKPIF